MSATCNYEIEEQTVEDQTQQGPCFLGVFVSYLEGLEKLSHRGEAGNTNPLALKVNLMELSAME